MQQGAVKVSHSGSLSSHLQEEVQKVFQVFLANLPNLVSYGLSPSCSRGSTNGPNGLEVVLEVF